MKNPALFNSDCVDHVITTAPVSFRRSGRNCESSTGNAPPARKPGVPTSVGSRSTYAPVVRDLYPRQAPKNPPSYRLRVQRNMSTENRDTRARLVHRQCPRHSAIIGKVADHITSGCLFRNYRHSWWGQRYFERHIAQQRITRSGNIQVDDLTLCHPALEVRPSLFGNDEYR